MPPRTPPELLDAARAGERGALARLLSLVERGGDDGREVARLTYPLSGGAYTVGLTGAPGSGKSTLTSALVATMRAADLAVAVLAVDPSSPFTGGAILGDRVRMDEHTLDDQVFIRSMATRGHLGGLALATLEAVRVLDATGAGWVLLETVGVGQVEVEVAAAADTTVVVVNPGWGDAVQANKAGLMEIADLFVINKADRAGAADTRHDLESMLDLSARDGWRPPVIETVAPSRAGVAELWEAVERHRRHLEGCDQLERRRRARLGDELEAALVHQLRELVAARVGEAGVERLRGDVLARRVDPWTAAGELVGGITSGRGDLVSGDG